MGERLALLLGISSQRLIRYESFLQRSDLPVIAYLNEDFETLPELHAFLGNYRRYCHNIIEGIACAMPQEAVTYILDQTVRVVESTCRDFRPPFQSKQRIEHARDFVLTARADEQGYMTPLPVLQLEAQSSVLRSTLNGFGQWLSKLAKQDSGHVSDPTNNLQVTLLIDPSLPPKRLMVLSAPSCRTFAIKSWRPDHR